MKTLSEIRTLFVEARKLAKEASPAKAEEAANMLRGISDHCKELYSTTTSYMERAKCRNIYESIDNVIVILKKYGFYNSTVMAFFGLLDSKATPSFSDISKGKGTIKAVPADSDKVKGEPIASMVDSGKKPDDKEKRKVPPPPPPVSSKNNHEDPANQASESVDSPIKNSGSTPAASVEAPAPAGAAVADAQGESGKIIYPESNPMAPSSLDDFIGQTEAINKLKEEIAAAKVRGEKHLDHILLFGNRGLGKSTIMKLVAKELGVDFEFIDCTSLMNDVRSQRLFQDFFINISKTNRPVVIGLDEIHALPKSLQSTLLTVLNDRIFSYMTESGTKCVAIPDFTFIGATTDYDALLQPLKDRCHYLTFVLKDYTRDELRRIFKRKLGSKGLKAEESVVDACVNRCRSSIRELEAVIKGLDTKAVTLGTDLVTLEMAERLFEDRGIDKIGLKEMDRRILQAIADEAKGFISEETLAARVYLDPKILTKEYEPFLMKIGFISVTSRGRYLTPKADDYLKYGYYDFGEGITVGHLPSEGGKEPVNPPKETPPPAAGAKYELPVSSAPIVEKTPEPSVEATVAVAETPVFAEGVAEAVAETPVPAQGVAEAVAETPVPAEGVAEAVAETPVPTEGVAEAVAETPVSAQGVAEAVAETPVPAEGVAEAVAETPVPAEGVAEAVAETPVPAQGVAEAVAETPVPAQGVAEAVAETPVPTEGVAEAVAEMPIPAEGGEDTTSPQNGE